MKNKLCKKTKSLRHSSDGSCDSQLLNLNVTSVVIMELFHFPSPSDPNKFHFSPQGLNYKSTAVFSKHLASENYPLKDRHIQQCLHCGTITASCLINKTTFGCLLATPQQYLTFSKFLSVTQAEIQQPDEAAEVLK